ncbi:hypothetical protein SISNIDRAFT_413852, partial [Sistotremastrum niveocremeum HHB9708]
RPENAQELFNYRHAKLRETIDRTAEDAKQRFKIIQEPSEWSLLVHAKIVIAVFVLNNFIKAFNREPNEVAIKKENDVEMREAQDTTNMKKLRDKIAEEMWKSYVPVDAQ